MPHNPPLPSRPPEMSSQEASWHEHLAGMRAGDAARHQGADPAAVAAFASATAGPVILAGRHLHQASQGTIWTLQRVAREFAAWADDVGLPHASNPEAPGTRELLELGLATLVFCDARLCWRMLDNHQLAELTQQAEDMMWEMPLPEQLALQAHFRGEMDRIRALSGNGSDEPEKKTLPPTAGISSAIATPPPATALPASNGWRPNTESPLRTPSGPPRFA